MEGLDYNGLYEYLYRMKTSDLNISDKKIRKCEELASYDFLKRILRSSCDILLKRKVLKMFLWRPFSWKHLKNSISAIIKYMRYA